MQSKQQLPWGQQLVCHSNLPRTATDYAQNDQYAAIMEDLARKGVYFFQTTLCRSADLADINIMKLPQGKARAYHDQSEEFSRGYMQSKYQC